MTISLEEALKIVNESNDHRVIERLPIISQYKQPPEIVKLYMGLGLDTETTGLGKDAKLIEIGLVPFTFDMYGNIYDIGEPYCDLEDPGFPIPEEASRINHIYDADVKGKKFDDDKVNELVRKATLIIAHNAGYDRDITETRFPAFIEKRWACSQKGVDWRGEGCDGTGLSNVLRQKGYFYEGHRAEIDVRAMIHALALPSENEKYVGKNIMKSVLDDAARKSYEIWAVGAPFEVKDYLKENGFRWNDGADGRPKSWFIPDVAQESLQEVMPVLVKAYGRRMEQFPFAYAEIDSFLRYSTRIPTFKKGIELVDEFDLDVSDQRRMAM